MVDTVPESTPPAHTTPECKPKSEEKAEEERRTRAAVNIQRHYRGHKVRREMNGMCITPDQRWTEVLKDARWRKIASHGSHSERKLERSAWDRAVNVAMKVQHDDPDHGQESGGEHEDEHDKKKFSKRRKEEHNMTTMDMGYFLEMVDGGRPLPSDFSDGLLTVALSVLVKHRHGHNLRAYHEFWRQQDTKENFFSWLDYGEGREVNLKAVPRETLEREKVRYLSLEERQAYLVKVDGDGRLCWAKNGQRIDTTADYADSRQGIVPSDHPEAFHPYHPGGDESVYRSYSSSSFSSFSSYEPESGLSDDPDELNPGKNFYVSSAVIFNRLLRKTIRKNTWIFVADTSLRLYVGIKQSGTFQHSSFLHGARVRAAGLIKIKDGKLKSLSPLSGHYRPAPSQFREFLRSLQDTGVDLSGVAITRSYAILVGLSAYNNFKKGKKKIKCASRKVVDKAMRPSGHSHAHGSKEERKSVELNGGKEEATGGGQTEADGRKESGASHGREGDELAEKLMQGSREPKVGPA